MKTTTLNKCLTNVTFKQIIFCTLLIIYSLVSCVGQKSNEKVFQAYELRINGQADSAKIILEQIVLADSTNALAWFELCRATEHIGLSNPRLIAETIDKSLICINNAVEYDPDHAYYLSYKGNIETLKFYFALQTGDENALDYLKTLEETYLSVFKLDPTYYENKITLVEFFGGLPAEMGGDPEKAEKYATELEEVDLVSGAKAREILMAEDADYLAYWKKIVEKVPDNADAIQALGRVYLFEDNFDKASGCYQEAIELDPLKNVLYLDLARYYMMMAMQNPAVLDSVMPMIDEQFKKYLNSAPEPINPMKAWVYATLSMINRRMENEGVAKEYIEMAKNLDPFFSPAFGKPGRGIYAPPNVVVHDQGYYLSPF